jgi:hypothetical protein
MLNAYKQAVINLQPVLAKSIENRHHHDQVVIQNFILLSPFFKELQLRFSHEFAKNIVKRGKIYCINGKRCIFEEGERMMRLLMPLVGNFYKRPSTSVSDGPDSTVF